VAINGPSNGRGSYIEYDYQGSSGHRKTFAARTKFVQKYEANNFPDHAGNPSIASIWVVEEGDDISWCQKILAADENNLEGNNRFNQCLDEGAPLIGFDRLLTHFANPPFALDRFEPCMTSKFFLLGQKWSMND
jgi:hypothetical protein